MAVDRTGVEPAIGWLYDQFTGDDEDSRVCKDIPDASCRHQPRNFLSYLGANVLGKIADEIASARMILPWMLTSIGAPAWITGFVVPIREAGVLLPQLAVAAYVRILPIRKRVWLLGALLSAVALAAMALVARQMQGAVAGVLILFLLMLYSLARGLCSVSAKDVLGKTVSKTRRGTLMGYSVTISSIAVIVLGTYLFAYGSDLQSVDLFFHLLLSAAGLWLAGIVIFNMILEQPGSIEGGANALKAAGQNLSLLINDLPFRRFVIVRALLLGIALMPPFIVIMSYQNTTVGLGGLGGLVLANGIAGATSSVFWGRLGDRHSRLAISIAAALGALVGMVIWAMWLLDSDLLYRPLTYVLLVFSVAIAHNGARLSRKVYLVDMATSETRAAYVAVSNTVIGGAMLAAGAFGALADLFGPPVAILLLALMSSGAALYAGRLDNVSG